MNHSLFFKCYSILKHHLEESCYGCKLVIFYMCLCVSQEAEDWDSPKRSIRDSGYIDCWECERSDSLSPQRHVRDDSFDSLDSIGSRSHQTPSPDGLLAHGYSDGKSNKTQKNDLFMGG